MDQIKIGSFLKQLRKEKNLTQENLAERLNVSGRTVSRWETGSNMPDIGMLIEIAEFYDVSIPEIINGERKSESMTQETKDTAVKMAEYSKNEAKSGKRQIIGYMAAAFGIFIIISALTIFPSDSSWGSIYSVFGSIVLLTGVYFIAGSLSVKLRTRILSVALCAVLLFGAFAVSDYLAVTQFGRVPRFSYARMYNSQRENEIVHRTLFFTAVQKDPGTSFEQVEIIKDYSPRYHLNGDQIRLTIRFDVKEDIGRLLMDFDIDGKKESGSMSGDDNVIKSGAELHWAFNEQNFDSSLDEVDMSLRFTVVTEPCEPGSDGAYPAEYTMPLDEVFLRAEVGCDYLITVSGDKTSGYRATLEDSYS
ncbi:MAG: helix-turn-helix transcriptional regulator [Clostridia bacterium]|nr:helix-turn-helix transcriptional regulator [Clostridia bacterium]